VSREDSEHEVTSHASAYSQPRPVISGADFSGASITPAVLATSQCSGPWIIANITCTAKADFTSHLHSAAYRSHLHTRFPPYRYRTIAAKICSLPQTSPFTTLRLPPDLAIHRNKAQHQPHDSKMSLCMNRLGEERCAAYLPQPCTDSY
jgi:hypothetical protein